MKPTVRNRLAAATALSTLAVLSAAPTFASSHREAPAITESPKVDGTDFYMFRSYEPGREGFVTLIANYQPLQGPYYGPNYFTMDPDALYEIHIDNNGDAAEDITFQFQFTNTLRNNNGITLNIGGVTQPIPLRHIGAISNSNDPDQGELESYQLNVIRGDRRTGAKQLVTTPSGGLSFAKPIDYIGTKTFPGAGAYAGYANSFISGVIIPGCAAGGRVFVGQRSEAFAVNLGESFDLVNYVPIQGAPDPTYSSGPAFPGGITQNRANRLLKKYRGGR